MLAEMLGDEEALAAADGVAEGVSEDEVVDDMLGDDVSVWLAVGVDESDWLTVGVDESDWLTVGVCEGVSDKDGTEDADADSEGRPTPPPSLDDEPPCELEALPEASLLSFALPELPSSPELPSLLPTDDALSLEEDHSSLLPK
jgi:hypothetical protein